jgi:hypothetical protein
MGHSSSDFTLNAVSTVIIELLRQPGLAYLPPRRPGRVDEAPFRPTHKPWALPMIFR